MSKVRIVQLLCASRHCIVATAYESSDGAEIPEIAERLREFFADWVKAGANPWCGLCNSRDLRAEDQPTRWATMDEAAPHLAENAAAQAATRAYFKARQELNRRKIKRNDRLEATVEADPLCASRCKLIIDAPSVNAMMRALRIHNVECAVCSEWRKSVASERAGFAVEGVA